MILHAPMNRRLTYAQAQAIRRRYAALRAQDGLQPGERVGEGDCLLYTSPSPRDS